MKKYMLKLDNHIVGKLLSGEKILHIVPGAEIVTVVEKGKFVILISEVDEAPKGQKYSSVKFDETTSFDPKVFKLLTKRNGNYSSRAAK